MKTGILRLAASVVAGLALNLGSLALAAPMTSPAELAKTETLTAELLAAIGATASGAEEADYEGQLAITIEQAGDPPIVVVGALQRAIARPGLPRPAMVALRTLLNESRHGRVRTTAAVGDTGAIDGAIFERVSGGYATFKTPPGGSDYSH